MVIAYVIILCLSSALGAYASARLSWRLSRMVGIAAVPPGVFAVVSAVAFLTVVAAPSLVLVASIILLLAGIAQVTSYLPPIARWGVPLIAVTLGLTGLHAPALPIPTALVEIIALLGWFALTLSATRAPNALPHGAYGFIAALLPLCAAPLIASTAPSSIALDACLIIAALLGLLATRQRGLLSLARTPLAFLLGWLILTAAFTGAWPAALISALAWGGAIAYATLRSTDAGTHALSP